MSSFVSYDYFEYHGIEFEIQLFLNTIFVSSHIYPENQEGPK